MVSRGLVELDVQERVVTVGDKEGTTIQEAVTANRSPNSHELKDIAIGHHVAAQPYSRNPWKRGHSHENHFVTLNPDPSVCWIQWH